jgi:hypothetical protein
MAADLQPGDRFYFVGDSKKIVYEAGTTANTHFLTIRKITDAIGQHLTLKQLEMKVVFLRNINS